MCWGNGPAASLRNECRGFWMAKIAAAAAVVVMVVMVVCLCLHEQSWEGQSMCGTGGVGLPW